MRKRHRMEEMKQVEEGEKEVHAAMADKEHEEEEAEGGEEEAE